MDLNKRILKQGLISIGIILILVLGFVLFIKLDNPVFLKSYMEYRVVEDEGYNNKIYFQLKYISNVYDQRRISKIEFMDNGNNIFGFPVYNGYLEKEDYGVYRLNRVDVQIDSNNFPKEFDSLELNNARITFYKGGTTQASHEDTIDVDLGRIVLNKENRDEGHFQFVSGGGGNERFYDKSRAKEDVSLLKLEFPMFDKVDDLYDIKIDGKDYKNISGIEYKEGDIIEIIGEFKKPGNNLNKYTELELRPRLYLKDSRGEEFNENIAVIINKQHEYSFLEIIKYLRIRGEI